MKVKIKSVLLLMVVKVEHSYLGLDCSLNPLVNPEENINEYVTFKCLKTRIHWPLIEPAL